MKRTLQLALAAGLVASTSPARAREGDARMPVDQPFRGMYVGIDSSITSIAGSAGAMVGPQLGVVAGGLVFGVAGYGLGGAVEPTHLQAPAQRTKVSLGYGVIQAGALLFADEPVHVTPLLLFGGGAVTVARTGAATAGEAIFVLEPKLEIEIAPRRIRALRFGAHGSYRFVSAFELAGLDAPALSGPAAGGFVKLGFF